jgi:prepilin-type N-terminal cleavage/methylation domain-containing protein
MKGERGYTLIETMMVLIITGFLAVVLGLVVQQVVSVPEKGSVQVNALHSIQNAAHWMALDAQMAASATGGSALTITLPSGNVSVYALSGTDLQRTFNGDNRTVAEYVSSVNFTVLNRVIYMTIVTTPGNRWDVSENQTYQVYMRPTEITP